MVVFLPNPRYVLDSIDQEALTRRCEVPGELQIRYIIKIESTKIAGEITSIKDARPLVESGGLREISGGLEIEPTKDPIQFEQKKKLQLL